MAQVEEPDDRKTHGDRGDGRHGAFQGKYRGSFDGPARPMHVNPPVRPGTLLVSATTLTESSFRRSVVYVLEHNDGGSLGLVLNRSTDTPVRSVLPHWAPLAARPGTLYLGGPVKRDAAMCLAVLRVGVEVEAVPGMRRVDGRVALVDLDTDPARIAPYVEGIRIFAGYSGWTFGQLDGELQRDDWTVLSGVATDVMTAPGIDVWGRVLRRQPLPLALRASHPIDVARN